MTQKVLTMCTSGETLRSEAVGWTAEDADMVQPGHIGKTPGFPGPYSYDTPLHALADGWKILAPPTRHAVSVEGRFARHEWEWWFTKD